MSKSSSCTPEPVIDTHVVAGTMTLVLVQGLPQQELIQSAEQGCEYLAIGEDTCFVNERMSA